MDVESWVLNYPEIEKVCKLFSYDQLLKPRRYSYTPTTCYVQEGPQCGLVALAIIANSPTKDAVQRLYEHAKMLNYTYNGEMFSIHEMCELSKRELVNHDVKMYDGDINNSFIKEFLLKGGLMLVPYDSSKNFSPCTNNGRTAHWAAITGAVECENNKFYVLARQGKSRNIAVWSLDVLAESNAQLEEFSPDRKLEDRKYKLPEGGIAGALGLKNKSVLIYRLLSK